MKTKLKLLPILIFAFVSLLFAACEKDDVFQDLNPLSTKESDPIIPTNKFYAGFAYGEISFSEAGLSEDDWGWISKYYKQADTMYLPLYIKTEHYDGGEGMNVGEFRISCQFGKFVAEYYSRKGWAFMETNLYVSHKKPASCDPADFTAHHHLFRKTTDKYVLYVKKLPVYVIGHATVVRTQ